LRDEGLLVPDPAALRAALLAALDAQTELPPSLVAHLRAHAVELFAAMRWVHCAYRLGSLQ